MTVSCFMYAAHTIHIYVNSPSCFVDFWDQGRNSSCEHKGHAVGMASNLTSVGSEVFDELICRAEDMSKQVDRRASKFSDSAEQMADLESDRMLIQRLKLALTKQRAAFQRQESISLPSSPLSAVRPRGAKTAHSPVSPKPTGLKPLLRKSGSFHQLAPGSPRASVRWGGDSVRLF